jgi:hypothetical protein
MIADKGVSIYGQRIEFKPATHTNKRGQSWWGFDFANPTKEQGGAFISEKDQFELLRVEHQKIDELVRAGALSIQVQNTGGDAHGGGGDPEPGDTDDLPI